MRAAGHSVSTRKEGGHWPFPGNRRTLRFSSVHVCRNRRGKCAGYLCPGTPVRPYALNGRDECLSECSCRAIFYRDAHLTVRSRWVFVSVGEPLNGVCACLAHSHPGAAPRPVMGTRLSRTCSDRRVAIATAIPCRRRLNKTHRCLTSPRPLFTGVSADGAPLTSGIPDPLLDDAATASVLVPFALTRTKIRGRGTSPTGLHFVRDCGKNRHIALLINAPVTVSPRILSSAKQLAYRHHINPSAHHTSGILRHQPFPLPLLRSDSAGGWIWLFMGQGQDSIDTRRCGNRGGLHRRAIPLRHEFRGFSREMMNGANSRPRSTVGCGEGRPNQA